MNLTAISGFLTAAAVLWFGVLKSSINPLIFLDPHALILVIGGTIAAMLIAFPWNRVIDLVALMMYGVVFKKQNKNRKIVEDIIAAIPSLTQNPPVIQNFKLSHPFLLEGLKLIAEQVHSEQELREILDRRCEFFRILYTQDAKMLNALAKFPPAFGLLGASTGMISMMTSLGQGGEDAIGSAMAVALVATFWGIAVANLVLLPLADYAARIAADDFHTRKMIAEGVLMLKRKESRKFIIEKLNSYLPIYRRYTDPPPTAQVIPLEVTTNDSNPPATDSDKPEQETRRSG